MWLCRNCHLGSLQLQFREVVIGFIPLRKTVVLLQLPFPAPDAAVSGDSLGSEILNSPQPLATNETTITSVVCNVCIFNIFARPTACRKEFKFSAHLATSVLIVASWITSLDCRFRRLSGVDRNIAQAASSE